MRIQPAVKKETVNIAAATSAGSCLMFFVFWALHTWGNPAVPFGGNVIIGGVLGTAVAVANFFFMAVTVQSVAADENQESAYRQMRASYRYRTLLQIVWIILALILPFVQPAAGIIPLFFPSIFIKIRGILGMIKS